MLTVNSQTSARRESNNLSLALMALSMMIPGMFAGALQEAVDYRTFFIIVCCACAVTFIVTSFIKIDPKFGQKGNRGQ